MKEAEAAAPGIAPDAKPEYERVVNDMRAIQHLMAYYNAKVQAAALVMRYGYDHDMSHLVAARTLLAQSVEEFAKLTNLTDKTYRNAAGMQTSQRQIPVRGGPQTNHWRDLLPVYQKELATFDKRLTALRSGSQISEAKPTQLPQVGVHAARRRRRSLHRARAQASTADQDAPIASVAPELDGLKGIRVSTHQETPIHFTLDKPAQILVGFFKSNSRKQVNVSPDTEQWNILLPNAVSEAKGVADQCMGEAAAGGGE